jgi:hypothetical protein
MNNKLFHKFKFMKCLNQGILATRLATNPPFCKGLTSDKIGVLCQGFSGIGEQIFVLTYFINFD